MPTGAYVCLIAGRHFPFCIALYPIGFATVLQSELYRRAMAAPPI